MNKDEIKKLISQVAEYFPERMSGNEQTEILTKRLAPLIQSDRAAVVDLLHDWLALRIPQSERKPEDGKREFWMWLAIEVAKRYSLNELRSDIESLLADVRAGKTFLPYYGDMIAKCIK